MAHQPLILILETDDLIRQLLERWLDEAGYGVLGPTRPGTPDLVIANLSSPRRALPLIRALKDAHTVPLLAISARFRRGLGGSGPVARQLGVRRVLAKPFTAAELLAAVAATIGHAP